MNDIFRVFECHNGVLIELAFVKSLTSVKEYLESCNLHNTSTNTFYFAELIKIET